VVSGGVACIVFQTLYVLAVGGGIITSVGAMAGRVTHAKEYKDCTRLFAKVSSALFASSSLLLVILIALATMYTPTQMVLAFQFSIFGAPLMISLLLMVLTTTLLFFQYRMCRTNGSSNYVGYIGAFLGCVSFLFYSLINTYMLTPFIPDGLEVVVKAGKLDAITQLTLMANRSWIPLTLKVLLVGATTFSVLMSSAAALRRATSRGEGAFRWHDFLASWGFKAGIMFGAPLGIIGYWNAAIMHTATPVLALGLMGEESVGTTEALISSLSPFWNIGIIGAMSLAGLAGVYYLCRGNGRITTSSDGQRVLWMFLPWVLLLLAIATYATLDVGESYPDQYILSLLVLPGGFVLFESVRRYSAGQERLYLPATIFLVACYSLIVYMAPKTKWYLAQNFGGVCWPLIGFPLLVVGLYVLSVHWQRVRYWIPVSAAFLALVIVLVKTADVELIRGGTIVALDPTVQKVVQSWGFINSYELNSLYTQYPIPTLHELLTIILLSGGFIATAYYLAFRSAIPVPADLEVEHQR
jgi:hypothetical protein